MKTKNLLITTICLISSYAALGKEACLRFDLKSHRSELVTPTVINELLFFESRLPQDKGSILLFLDYSDRGNILDKHAYIECIRSKNKMFRCETEEYNLFFDLQTSDTPVLHFKYLMISDLDDEYIEVKTKSDQTLRIAGDRKSCMGLNRENQVLESE